MIGAAAGWHVSVRLLPGNSTTGITDGRFAPEGPGRKFAGHQIDGRRALRQ